jgi:hypothetical protein
MSSPTMFLTNLEPSPGFGKFLKEWIQLVTLESPPREPLENFVRDITVVKINAKYLRLNARRRKIYIKKLKSVTYKNCYPVPPMLDESENPAINSDGLINVSLTFKQINTGAQIDTDVGLVVTEIKQKKKLESKQ